MSALIEEALRQIDAACDKTRAAMQAEAYARAEWVSLTLYAMVERDPTIESFTLELSWEYDDESSYYTCVGVWAERGVLHPDPALEDEITDELLEVGNMIDEATAHLLGESITVAQLRERMTVIS